MSKEALSYLYRIISRKDYTEYEIREKLHFRFNLEENAIDSLIDKLKKEDLIDDARFAKMYIEHKILAGYGPLYIIAALSKKGINIDEKYIYDVTGSMDIKINDIIKDLLMKKRSLTADKYYGFLQRRGFKTDEIKELLMEVNKNGSTIF